MVYSSQSLVGKRAEVTESNVEKYRHILQHVIDSTDKTHTTKYASLINTFARTLKNDFDRLFPIEIWHASRSVLQKLADQYCYQDTNRCPFCNGTLVIKSGKYGQFLGCIDFPQCKGSRTIDGEVVHGVHLRHFISEKVSKQSQNLNDRLVRFQQLEIE